MLATLANAQPAQDSPNLSFRKLDSASQVTPQTSQEWSPPDYMENWKFGIDFGQTKIPFYFADLIFPLLRPSTDTRILFVEPRVNHRSGETLLNNGIGYRQLVKDRSWMLGTNFFYDYDTHLSHYRVGTGLEAISVFSEFRANGYFGLSPARVAEPGGNTEVVEKAVNGFDVEVGAPVPYYSRLKVFGGYEWYDFGEFKDRNGWSFRAEFKPIPTIVWNILLSNNTKSTLAWGANVAFRIPFGNNTPEKWQSPFKLDKEMFPPSDVSNRLVTLVERHNEIVVKRYTRTAGQVNIEVRRGT